jgi:hypothetical protein
MKKLDFPNYEILRQQIGTFEGKGHLHFFTKRLWSSYDLLLYLLTITGTAKVTLSSFSISDITIRTIHNAIEAGYISSIDLILHNSVKKNKLELLFFAGNVVDRICLANSHSKIMLIENEDWKISVNQSANASVNYAEESGVICNEPEVFEFYRKNIDRIFADNIIVTANDFK